MQPGSPQSLFDLRFLNSMFKRNNLLELVSGGIDTLSSAVPCSQNCAFIHRGRQSSSEQSHVSLRAAGFLCQFHRARMM